MDDKPEKNIIKVLSCIPEQKYTYQEKLTWLDETAKLNPGVDIFVTPQEYFGGDVIMPEKTAFEEGEILPDLLALSERHDMAFIVGLVEKCVDGKNRQRIWFMDHRAGGIVGKITKFALPSYTHVEAGGSYQIHPETDLRNRIGSFELRGAKVAGLFCWEVFSDFLWFAMGLDEPDFVVSMIKFGAMAYPKVEGSKKQGRRVGGFGISSGKNVWLERLIVASRWEVNCPIICSTNSWGLPASSEPLCGMVPDMLGVSSLWKPPKAKKGLGAVNYERVVVDRLDLNHIRGLRKNRWQYLKEVGEFPPYEMRTFTMWTKIQRIERTLDGAEELVEIAISEGKVRA